jgi:hypothetical protein
LQDIGNLRTGVLFVASLSCLAHLF